MHFKYFNFTRHYSLNIRQQPIQGRTSNLRDGYVDPYFVSNLNSYSRPIEPPPMYFLNDFSLNLGF